MHGSNAMIRIARETCNRNCKTISKNSKIQGSLSKSKNSINKDLSKINVPKFTVAASKAKLNQYLQN